MRYLDFATPRAGFTFDISGDLDMAKKLSGNVHDIEKAQKRAVGTLVRRLRVMARRDIQTEYSLKAQAINERLSISRKYDGIALVGKATGINLINFGARQTRTGVSYSVKKGVRKTMAHAFIRSTRSGRGPFVWLRGDAGSRYSHHSSAAKGVRYQRHGYPIFQQFGPSVAQMLKHGQRPERIEQAAEHILQTELNRLLGPK